MLNERKPGALCVTQPGLLLSAKSSNKAIATAIFLDMHTSATPRHATYFCFILFQASVHKISEACFRPVYTKLRENVQFRHPSIVTTRRSFSFATLLSENLPMLKDPVNEQSAKQACLGLLDLGTGDIKNPNFLMRRT